MVQDWRQEITAEFHGHHFPYPQRMLRTERYKLIVNPADINELYDLQEDPYELVNCYEHPELAHVRRALMERLYELLKNRGDNFYHWMTSMYEIGAKAYDTSLSQFER
jgi:arylsulfatase A-like enzyme